MLLLNKGKDFVKLYINFLEGGYKVLNLTIMNERRKGKRVPFNSKISVSSLYRSGEQQLIELKDIEILVTNISSTGVGFQSKINLPVDYFFNCRLDIPTSASIYCVVKIVRSEKLSDSKIYDIGCEIVGLSSICSDIINSYVNNC